jgi:hypothetical protein
MKTIRRYSELKELDTIKERFEYLRLGDVVGKQSWGWDRYFAQRFYRTPEWKRIRHHVIARDLGCDLGIEGFEIYSYVMVHHMNPIWIEDLKHGNPAILDPEYLITTCDLTHKAIHYGDASLLPQVPVERRPGDTRLWR